MQSTGESGFVCSGYGNSAPNDCWWATVFITIQTIMGLIMDALTIGIVFARISHPKNRGRTIGISDSCCISRRDGVLKLMFRIADFRKTQVCVFLRQGAPAMTACAARI